MSDDWESAGSLLPRIDWVEPVEDRILDVSLNGVPRRIDLRPVLESRRIYIPLRNDEALFRTAEVGEDRISLEWEGGLDVSALWLARLPDIRFTNSEFREAMDRLNLTLDGMASALQISRRLVASYRKDRLIPRHIGFATRYLLERSEG